MKNTRTKFVSSAIIFLSVIGFAGMAAAASSSLYVSPASLTKTAGDVFSVSVEVDASGNKVCAVEGILVFSNLTCQNITMAGGVTPQSSPTCSNPYFLLGVPGCTTANRALFTVSVWSGNAGAALINFTGVDVIGEGASLGSASMSGNYTINAVWTPTPTPTLTLTPTPTPTPTPGTAGQIIPSGKKKSNPAISPSPTGTSGVSVSPSPVASPAGEGTNGALAALVFNLGSLPSFWKGFFAATALAALLGSIFKWRKKK